MNIPEIIKTMRMTRELSVKELSELSGVTPQTINNTESGRNGMTVNTLIKLTRACDYELVIKPIYRRPIK